MLTFYYRVFAILVASFCITTELVAIGPEMSREELLPPPPGPYQLDPEPMSATIYEQGDNEAVQYPQRTDEYHGYNGPQYYRGSQQYQYQQPYAPPQGYYPQQRGTYGYGSQPDYQGYQGYQGYQPGYYPGQGYYGYPNR